MRFKFGIIFLLLIIQPVSALCKEGEIKTENKQTIDNLNLYNYYFNNGHKKEKEIFFAQKNRIKQHLFCKIGYFLLVDL
jgi:hypothetical protein